MEAHFKHFNAHLASFEPIKTSIKKKIIVVVNPFLPFLLLHINHLKLKLDGVTPLIADPPLTCYNTLFDFNFFLLTKRNLKKKIENIKYKYKYVYTKSYRWHVTPDIWHVTCDKWHGTNDSCHVSRDKKGVVKIVSKFQFPSFNSLGVMMF